MKKTHFLAQAAKLGGLTIVSSALGFARELLIAGRFGASHTTDSYLVALSVPSLIYALFFGSGLNVSLVPRLSVLMKEDPDCGRTMFARFLSGAALCGLLFSACVLAFPGFFVRIFAPGLAYSPVASAAVRALSPLVFLFVVSYGLASFHCASNQVAHWGLIPAIQNITLVIVLVVVGARFGLNGLLAGTVAGALIAFFVQACTARSDGFRERWADPFKPGPGRSMLFGMGAFALVGGLGGDCGTGYADLFLIRFFASHQAPGSITLLALGNKLMGLPVLLVGAALGLALLPSLSVSVAASDHARTSKLLTQALSCALLLVLPIAIVYCDLGAPIVHTLFRKTALLPGQLTELGWILRAYSVAVVGTVVMMILNAYLAALRRTKTLIAAGVLVLVANVGLMLLLTPRLGSAGIAMAISGGSVFYCLVLLVALAPHLDRQLRWTLFKRAGVLGAGALAMHLLLMVTVRLPAVQSAGTITAIVIPLLAGTAAYVGWLGLHRKALVLGLRGL